MDGQKAHNRLAEVRTLDENNNLRFRHITVDSSKRGKGILALYDLGFSILGCDLPPGRISCRLSGLDAAWLASDIDARSASDLLTLELTCLKVSRNGAKLRHFLDKRWLLKLATDPASKYLVVEEEKQLPVWC